MGSPSPARRRRVLPVLALCAAVAGTVATLALAAGPGGWDHLGDRGTPGSKALNLVASALTVTPGALYVGGEFTDAGGIPEADRIATWNGSSWAAVSSATSQIGNGRVSDIAVADGKVYAGGTFQDAGGNANADHLAVWDGTSWKPFCDATGPAFEGNVSSLEIVGATLYVGGFFQDGAGIASADYLLACALPDGESRSTVVNPDRPFTGPVHALTVDANGTLYAGGRFDNLEGPNGAENVAFRPVGGGWTPMGPAAGPCLCAVTSFVRALTAVGTDVYIGTDAKDVAGIAQADHVARWDGSAWHALGANSGGGDGWFSTTTFIYGLAAMGPNVFATGSFQNANGDPRADSVAFFDGTSWRALGSDGAGNGPWIGDGLALAVADRQLYAAGGFPSAGGDTQAQAVASFALAQVIAFPTPTVTPGPSAVPTPTVTPAPPAPDVTPPATSLRSSKISQAKRRATFKFASSEPGSTFVCKLDAKRAAACASPKTYKKLRPGKHVFRVRARDRAGNLDRSPTVKRFKIRRR